jgi:acyl-CoA synthetase (AMP-forming)/AMP-acid ligase II
VSSEPQTLRELLVHRAAVDPDRLAYAAGPAQITFRELALNAERQAERLVAMGVRARDRVALVMSSGIPFAEAFWALQLIGATPCAFSPNVPAPTLERRTARVRPRLAVTDRWMESALQPGIAPPEPHLTADDIAYIQPTSGTSGEPRAAMIRHRNVLGYLHADHSVDADASRDDRLVSWVPPWHDLGLVKFFIGSVHRASPCHIVQPAVSTIPEWLATVTRTRATITGGPDFCYRLASRMVDPASVDLTSLRVATNGGEPVRWSTIETFERRFGLDRVILPGYGLAEATLGVTLSAPGDEVVVDSRGNVSCGKPRPGTEVRIEASTSSPGEILFRGPSVFAGYLDSPDETRDRLREGWLHTGDIGYLDREGRLFVLGRQSGMIKRGGAVVAPRELEEAAQEVAEVRLAAAVSVPARSESEETVAIVVETGRSDPASKGRLAKSVSHAIVTTSGFAPGQVVVVPPRTIPLSSNGKVRHGRMRELLLEGQLPQSAPEAALASEG